MLRFVFPPVAMLCYMPNVVPKLFPNISVGWGYHSVLVDGAPMKMPESAVRVLWSIAKKSSMMLYNFVV